MDKLYAERDTEDLGQHYTNHLNAMTSENLHNKSDIAAELAYRDSIIEKLNCEIYSLQCSVDDLKSEIVYIEGLIQEDELT